MARAIFVVMLLGVGLAAAVPQRWGSSTDPSDPAGVVGHITYEPDTGTPSPPPRLAVRIFLCAVGLFEAAGRLKAVCLGAAAPLTNSDVSRSMDDDEATLSELYPPAPPKLSGIAVWNRQVH